MERPNCPISIKPQLTILNNHLAEAILDNRSNEFMRSGDENDECDQQPKNLF